jgi:hydroxyacyl-ACP dehydratase HTD2-like protein with hotdog domain
MSGDLESIPIGATIAQWVCGPLGRSDLQRYAQASGDLNPLHLDSDFARKAGFPDVIVHGMLGMALLGRLIEDHMPKRKLLAFRATFRKVIHIDQPIVCRARLASRVNHEAVLTLEALGPDHSVLVDGSATVELPEANDL